jgi:hypothetical protein
MGSPQGTVTNEGITLEALPEAMPKTAIVLVDPGVFAERYRT